MCFEGRKIYLHLEYWLAAKLLSFKNKIVYVHTTTEAMQYVSALCFFKIPIAW